jgi:hypothetical protein
VKIQKGVLSDTTPTQQRVETKPGVGTAPQSVSVNAGTEVEKNRLFETLDNEHTSNRSYAKLLAAAIVVVLIAGGVIFYMTLPKPGDIVRAPKGLEQAVRDHLSEKQKRDANDITFYFCGPGSYRARAGVETRKDIPNPVYKIGSYAVTAKGSDGDWSISSKPVNTADDDRPCN